MRSKYKLSCNAKINDHKQHKDEMECKASSVFSFKIKDRVLPYFCACIITVAVLAAISNALLIWGLKKTRQTSTISFQFIIVMSTSDVILCASHLIKLTISTVIEYNATICWITLFCQFIATTCTSFSFLMVAFIALDRYLHMRYLERYPSIVTKRRAYCLTIMSILLLVIVNATFALPAPSNVQRIFQTVYLFFATPIVFTILMLYYYTMKTIRKKASQATRNVINQTRALSKASNLITVSTTCLLMLLLTSNVIKLVNRHHRFSSSSLLDEITMISYAIYSSNAFWSSFVFMRFNRPIRLLFKRIARNSVCCRRAAVISTSGNV